MRETGAEWETDDMASELMTAGLPLGGALTLVGLLISFFVWRSKGAAAGLRGVSWSLVPLAAGLLGLLSAVSQFVSSIFTILVNLVFNPIVWAGVALTGLAVVLYIVSGMMRSRGVGVKTKGGASAGSGGAGAPAGSERPAADGAAPAGKVGGAPAKGGDDDLSDFSDIEALLKKRGIE